MSRFSARRRASPALVWIALALALAVAALSVTNTRAHEWYPPACCSGGDCAPIAGERVQATPEGFLVDGKFSIPRAEVKDSMDGRYHGCFPNPDTLRCFFAPPPGS